MSEKHAKKYIVDFIFTLCLFGVFAICALLVVVIGANVYRFTVNTQEANSAKRTSLAYVAEKIRQNDEADSVLPGSIEDTPALILKNTYGEDEYYTYIYMYEGTLRELFVKKDTAPLLLAGQVITEISDFSIEQISQSLYRICAADKSGGELSMYIHPMCSQTKENPS